MLAIENEIDVMFMDRSGEPLLLMLPCKDERMENLRTKAIARLEDYRSKIKSLEGEVVPDVAAQIRGWEGVASKIYFDAI